jgi:hypothetical protein
VTIQRLQLLLTQSNRAIIHEMKQQKQLYTSESTLALAKLMEHHLLTVQSIISSLKRPIKYMELVGSVRYRNLILFTTILMNSLKMNGPKPLNCHLQNVL